MKFERLSPLCGALPAVAEGSSAAGCEPMAPALDAGRHCNALNHNAGSLQKVINIARQFTLCGLIRFPETDAREWQKRVDFTRSTPVANLRGGGADRS